MTPQLSILMAGLVARERKIEGQITRQMLDHCTSEISIEYPHIPDGAELKRVANEEVEFISYIDSGEETSGYKRQQLLNTATGRYVCFIDDDDKLSDYYLPCLLRGTKTEADVITFKLQMVHDGHNKDIWTFGLHTNKRKEGLMCVNHLCAWRKDLTRFVSWSPHIGRGDVLLWFQPLFAANVIRTQYHINKVLYYYLFSSKNTINQSKPLNQKTRKYYGTGLRCFFLDTTHPDVPASLITEVTPPLSEIPQDENPCLPASVSCPPILIEENQEFTRLCLPPYPSFINPAYGSNLSKPLSTEAGAYILVRDYKNSLYWLPKTILKYYHKVVL
jgi:hypothetical protein